MVANEEVELKLQADPAAIAHLLADPLFADHAPTTRDLLSTYFDTERHALRKAGLSLRIRRSGERFLQTVKAEGKAAASLFARPEWECEVGGDRPELDRATAALVDTLDAAGGPPPAPIFFVEVNRTSVVRGEDGNRIEMVADQGRIVAGSRHGAIAEIELELLDGDRAALFGLARRLSGRAPLRLGVRSKSERGYALLAESEAPAAKAEPIALAPDDDAGALFEAIAGACIRQFRLNEDRLLATGAPEALHQARVGLRRLRSALTIFRAMLAGPEHVRFAGELRALAGRLGALRDVDVLIARVEDGDALVLLRAARQARFRDAVAMLDSEATRTLMLDLAEWIAIGAWRAGAASALPALAFAPDVLDRLRGKVARRGRHLARLDEADRHQVRIAAKKLRYAAEFFSGLYPGRKAGRRREAFLGAIGDMQDALGDLNDLAGGRALFAELGIAEGDVILGKTGKRAVARLLDDAEEAHARLVAVKPFWRRTGVPV